ncbi:COX15/CtaA family protein [Sneathiella sp.]|uniref:COX15/CtaA family protein n=1 Tax=Sneathiella sp. TaxID=1964365 RepID=UPI0035684DD1
MTADSLAKTNKSRSLPGPRARRMIVGWLVLVALLVFAMIVLGGVTRLTNSGLSMTDWKPVTGWLPPLDHAAWVAEFERYKAYPEYQKINHGMTLTEFQEIYAFEFAHRLLGRVIGVAFFVPFVLFLVAGKIRGPLVPRLALLFVLGGLQGGMGWFMVQSGLVDNPDVSHYRLTAHLALASLIYAVILWTIFDLLRGPARAGVAGPVPLLHGSIILLVLIALQILIGGFVAGLDAGFVYNDWPTMGGHFFPEDMLYLKPWYLNFLENPAAVQFCHRMLGYLVAVAAVLLFLGGRSVPLSAAARRGLALLFTLVVAQVLLGILTLIHVVPVPLAAAHQAGGMLVLAAALFLVHDRRRSAGTRKPASANADRQ